VVGRLRLGQAEVRQFRVAVPIQKHVRRLDVAVHDPRIVRLGEADLPP